VICQGIGSEYGPYTEVVCDDCGRRCREARRPPKQDFGELGAVVRAAEEAGWIVAVGFRAGDEPMLLEAFCPECGEVA
jgi:hypothetical protein